MLNRNLGQTDVVKQQISTVDEQAVKQLVHCHFATQLEDMQYFIKDMLALGKNQESSLNIIMKKCTFFPVAWT